MGEALYSVHEQRAAQQRLREAGIVPCPGTISAGTIDIIYKAIAIKGGAASTTIRVLLEEREILLARLRESTGTS